MIRNTPRDPKDFDLLYADALCGKLSAAEWRELLLETPGLQEWLDEQEEAMRRAGYVR